MKFSTQIAVFTIFTICYFNHLKVSADYQQTNSTFWPSPIRRDVEVKEGNVFEPKTRPSENVAVGTGKTWLTGGVGFKIKEFIFYISATALFVSISIIILTAPLQRRSLQGRSFSSTQHTKMMEIFEGRGILDSDNCVEKIACQLGDNVRRSGMGNWGQRFVDSIPQSNRVVKRFARAYNVEDCYSYRCEPLTFLAKLLIYVVDFNTVLKTIL